MDNGWRAEAQSSAAGADVALGLLSPHCGTFVKKVTARDSVLSKCPSAEETADVRNPDN